MAGVKTVMAYRYKITLQYLNIESDTATSILDESIKSVIIDHNYDVNCMPVIFFRLNLDKSLVDDMIKNQNTNMMIIAISKYDSNDDMELEIECIRKKCIYFLTDDVNKMDPVDYNEENEELMRENTYMPLTVGLLVLDHVNNNKTHCELTAKNTTNYDIVKHITSHMGDMVIEPFYYNDTFEQLILPSKDSVNKALKFLNNNKVFYPTPYRYYQDFNYTYIISSSGAAIDRYDETYTNILIHIEDIDSTSANVAGLIANRESGSYEVHVNYANTQVYDNTLINKSRTKVRGITSSGSTDVSLTSTASYMKDTYQTQRINNDNEHMIENIEADNNTKNFLIYFSKNDLDTDLFTLNKRITIHNIDRYQEYNGVYLLYRKREVYLREGTSFVMNTMINIRRIDENVSE